VKVDGDHIYIALDEQHQIFLYMSSGTLLKRFGKEEPGCGEGEFNHPLGLAVDQKFLYICDNGNNRVQVLRKDNALYSHQWGAEGTNEGQFSDLRSIHLSEDIVYVGDEVSVQLFTTRGGFLQRLGQTKCGDENGQFFYVNGLLVVADRLYVSDSATRRIQVFSLKE